tara:strand:+ start:833 stop:2197 length:1365 start_codon:yes stop_codon:yes gene_type:complete
MTIKTLDFLKNTILDFVEPNQKFTLQEILERISEPSWDSCYDGRTDEESRKACIRRDLQILRDENFITFVDNDGTYLLNDVSEDFKTLNEEFDTKESWAESDKELELIKMKHAKDLGVMPLPRGEGIRVEGDPLILKKDEIIDHDEAVRLNLVDYYQAREGSDIDMDRVVAIQNSVKSEGYQLGIILPTVSKLKPREGALITKPIMGSDGKLKKYVLRNGLHRFKLDDEDFRCLEIDSDHEDFLRLFGTTANNPTSTQTVGITTKQDAVGATRMWIKKGRLEKNVDKVCKFLKEKYPHITPSNRIGTAREILELEGIKISIKPWSAKEIRRHVNTILNLPIEIDWNNKIARFSFVLNSNTTMDRYMRQVERFQVENSDFEIEVYYALDNTPASRNEEVTPQNVRKLRRDQRQKFEESAELNIEYSKLKKRGKIKPIKFVAVYQDNINEENNSFY